MIGRSASTVRQWETEGNYLAHEAITAGRDIVVANQESLSPQQEMVQDLLAIGRTFSCRLYGLRRYEKTLKTDDLTGGQP